MKNRQLPSAMLIGLALAASSAQAVYVNPKGLGEVLLYPYYTVENGQDTYFSIANTTDTVKAVKVRLRESMNSAGVLDFNLYLSPFDHWAGTITRDPNGVGALLNTADESCTVPAIPAVGVKLHNVLYSDFNSANQHADGGPEGLERTREGYIEVIEMGTIDDGGVGVSDAFVAEAAATHVDGVPANCALLRAAWQEQPLGSGNVVGNWDVPTSNFLPFDPELTGGLYGYGVLINVMEGTNATYDAVALDAFADKILHTRPGAATPTLADAAPIAKFIEENQFISLSYISGLDAVSAVLMQDSLFNDYVLEPSIAAGTEWVVTMPTKRDYVNVTAPATAPFTEVWQASKGACDGVQITYWDREEQQPAAPSDDWTWIRPWNGPWVLVPPTTEEMKYSLCNAANVISFLSSAVDLADANLEGYSSPLYPSARTQMLFSVAYDNGLARLSMALDNADVPYERILTALDGAELYGLPVIGFAVQKYANTNLAGASDSGAFYSGVINHKATRDFVLP